MNKFDSHIKITSSGANHFHAECSVCKMRGIVDCARISNDSPVMKDEIKRINREHKGCPQTAEKLGLIAEPVFTETADEKLSAVKTQIIGRSLLEGEKAFTRTVRAIEKAIVEFEENKSIDYRNGVLSFVSRTSGKPRKVTKFGCHESCDCGGQISYHHSLFALCEGVQGQQQLRRAA